LTEDVGVTADLLEDEASTIVFSTLLGMTSATTEGLFESEVVSSSNNILQWSIGNFP